MEILNDIKKIEEFIFKNTYEYKNYYNFLSEYSENRKIFLDFYETLSKIENRKINIFKKKLFLNLKKEIDYNDFELLKKNNDLLNFFVCLLITKNFSRNSLFDVKKENVINIYDIVNNISIELEKIIIYIEIKNKINLNLNLNEIWHFIMKIILNLIDLKKIESNLTIVNNKKNRFLSINNIMNDNSIILSYNKYEIYEKKNEYYLYSNHFSFTNKIFKENSKSGCSFKTKIDSKLFDNLKNNWVFIDKIRLKNIYTDLIENNNLEENKIEENFIDMKNKLINFIKKKDYSSASIISKKISIFQNLTKIKNILNLDIENKKIYLPFIFDFRGRLYYDSEISPSFYKEFRYCINWGIYESFEIKEHIYNDIINNEIIKYLELIDNIKNYNFKNKNINIKISIIWILISLGEINKTKIGKEVHIKKFVEEGIKIINDENYELYEIYDKIKIKYLIHILKEINDNIYVKWLISKDATASVYQHLIKTCGYKNTKTLEWCNLKSKDTWYDTYSHIIDNFLKEKITEEKNDILREVINRKNLKKVIMTENYSAGFQTCKNYFLEKINLEKYNEDQKKLIKETFEIFYEYISNNKLMFENDISDILKFFKENEYIVYLNNETKDVIVLKYYKGIKQQKEILINNKRYSYQEFSINKIEDKIKTKSSLKANYIHTMDASLVRWFLSYNKAIAVHDCFFIDYINITYLVSCINEGMRIGFHSINKTNEINTSQIFSIFIVI